MTALTPEQEAVFAALVFLPCCEEANCFEGATWALVCVGCGTAELLCKEGAKRVWKRHRGAVQCVTCGHTAESVAKLLAFDRIAK